MEVPQGLDGKEVGNAQQCCCSGLDDYHVFNSVSDPAHVPEHDIGTFVDAYVAWAYMSKGEASLYRDSIGSLFKGHYSACQEF